MRFEDIENIWTVNLSTLSNAHRGRVFFERAKQVVSEALECPELRALAVDGRRFRRDYLVTKIGSQPAVTTQNPKIKQLLADTDRRLGGDSKTKETHARPVPGAQVGKEHDLQTTIDALRRKVEIQAAEISDLRRKLWESGWIDTELIDHGRLPW